MSDPELEAIRARRLAQMRAQQGGGLGAGAGPGAMDQQKAMQERKEKEDDFRNTILSQFLTQEARARLSNIEVTKPERAKMLENILIANIQRGAIREKLSEDQLKNFLEQVNEQTAKKQTTVKYDRRRTALDSDEDDEDL